METEYENVYSGDDIELQTAYNA